MSISIQSTVVVQREDRGPWTHGTIIGKGDHNHHNRSYKIHVANTGRIITHNRQHIKPTPITTADFLHYQANKHTRTDALDAILDNVLRHLPIPTDRTITHERSNNNNMPYEHKGTNSIEDIKGKQTEEECSNATSDNEYKNNGKIL